MGQHQQYRPHVLRAGLHTLEHGHRHRCRGGRQVGWRMVRRAGQGGRMGEWKTPVHPHWRRHEGDGKCSCQYGHAGCNRAFVQAALLGWAHIVFQLHGMPGMNKDNGVHREPWRLREYKLYTSSAGGCPSDFHFSSQAANQAPLWCTAHALPPKNVQAKVKNALECSTSSRQL